MKVGKIRINMIRNASFIDKENAFANIGESIQAVTMSYIYERLGLKEEDIVKVGQCDLKSYNGEPLIFPLRLPLSRENVDDYLPLNECIRPIFMSLHLHDDIFGEREDLVQYFKRYEPIGCRDEQSCNYFRQHGIEAYIMGCYTICLPDRENFSMKGKPFLVDVSPELQKYIPQSVKEEAVFLSQAVPFEEYPVTVREDERLTELAAKYLQRYREEAGFVVTSRLHVASPCIAMGIPVILASNNIDFRYAWIDKYLKLYQEDEYQEINWIPDLPDPLIVHKAKDLMFHFIAESIQAQRPVRKYLQEFDLFYRDRKRTSYYKCFRNRLKHLENQFTSQDSFSYGIWGAGCHAIFAHDLMNELFPKAKLRVVIDKYKSGNMFGVPIIRGNDIDQYDIQHICITTNPGLREAVAKCEELWGLEAADKYTIITSQQKS